MLDPSRQITVFISYAHRDDDFFRIFNEGLKTHLNTSSQFNFKIWEDSQIHVGSFWDNEIQENLAADLAVLCVSANFLNSTYIGEKELGNLMTRHSNTILLPVYFRPCTFVKWKDLAAIQFFKPGGENYGKAGDTDFAFSDLVKFNETNGNFIPNANIDSYFIDIVSKIENALMAKYNDQADADSTASTTNHLQKESPTPLPFSGQIPDRPAGPGLEFKIVSGVMITAIAASLFFVFYFLITTKDSIPFKSIVSLALFFGSLGFWGVYAKTHKAKIVAV